VMRQLPSGSIDLIYIDPPFFSGRNYNVIFGDQNELRSFSDIWEGGMPGYLIWLNARLYEMKRLLRKQGASMFTATGMRATISRWRWIRSLATTTL
jgi:DNA modification methylase